MFALAAVLLAPATAWGHGASVPPPVWELDLKGSWISIGGRPKTGGFTPILEGRRLFAVHDRVRLSVGLDAGAFGFASGEPRTLGVFGGLTIGVAARPWTALAVSFQAAMDVGRLPVCNAWGLCLRYIGLYPAAALGAAWSLDGRFAVGGSLTVRGVNTIAWQGASWEPGLYGRAAW